MSKRLARDFREMCGDSVETVDQAAPDFTNANGSALTYSTYKGAIRGGGAMNKAAIIAELVVIVQRMNGDGLGDSVHCNALQELCMALANDHNRDVRLGKTILKSLQKASNS